MFTLHGGTTRSRLMYGLRLNLVIKKVLDAIQRTTKCTNDHTPIASGTGKLYKVEIIHLGRMTSRIPLTHSEP